MLFAFGRDLGLVCDDQDLAARSQSSEQIAHYLGDPATNTHIYFIEHHARHSSGVGGYYADGETDARELATGCNFTQCSGGRPGIGADEKFDFLAAVDLVHLF